MTRAWLLGLVLIPLALLRLPARPPDFVGDATRYGPGFEGRPTASGETFYDDAMTGAVDPYWRSELMGRRVRVCSERACIVIKVNDICPECAVNGVIVDLPDKTFDLIGERERGRAFVKVWVIGRPSAGVSE